MDALLASVYDGEYIRDNDGGHIPASLPEGKEEWSALMDLVRFPLRQYNLPKGGVGRKFVDELARLIDGVAEGKWTMTRGN